MAKTARRVAISARKAAGRKKPIVIEAPAHFEDLTRDARWRVRVVDLLAQHNDLLRRIDDRLFALQTFATRDVGMPSPRRGGCTF